MKILGLTLVLGLAFVEAALVASGEATARSSGPRIDCVLAKSVTEQTICRSPDLTKLDRQLATEFLRARQGLGQTQRKHLSNQESDWMARRDTCGSNHSCISQAYIQRIAELQAGDHGINCASAKSVAEQTICNSSELSKLDRQLAGEYARAMQGLGQLQLKELMDQERGWMARRDACGSNASCIAKAYAQRIAELQAGAASPANTAAQNSGSGINCALAKSVTEQTICRSSSLMKRDRELAGEYASAVQGLGQPQLKELTDRELGWMARRDACGSNPSCISQAYTQRIAELQVGAAAHTTVTPAPATATAAPNQAPSASEVYGLDDQIRFNVLDQVDYEPQTGKIIITGHNDTRYATPTVPYLQYLATLLDNPSPKFSLEWTPDSERRVDDLRRRLESDSAWRALIREWMTWLDSSGKLTPAGRVFLPMFGISVAENLDRYQILSAILAAAKQAQPAVIVFMLRDIHLAWPHPSKQQVADFVSSTGTYDYAAQLNQEVASGRMTAAQREGLVFRAIWKNMDSAFGLTAQPLVKAYDAAIGSGQTPTAAFDVAVQEFNGQIQTVGGAALASLMQSKDEIQVPITLVNPALRDTVLVQPQYYGIDGTSLLAKLLFDADYASKKLVNMPELTGKIPRYQTQFAFRRNHPSVVSSAHTSASHLWISVDHVDASRSPDGNSLALGETSMRINIRNLGAPNQPPDEYEKLLTSLFDDFAQQVSPSFHQLREAAKVAYVARWLKAKDPALVMPRVGRSTWSSPSTIRGTIFVVWSPASARDVIASSAIGGIDLDVSQFRPEIIRTNSNLDPASVLIGAETAYREAPVPSGPGSLTGVIKVFLKPPGDCKDPKRYEDLREKKERACDLPLKRYCTGAQTCEELKSNREQNKACLYYRLFIMHECFRGGDNIHKEEVRTVRGTLADCEKLIRDHVPPCK